MASELRYYLLYGNMIKEFTGQKAVSLPKGWLTGSRSDKSLAELYEHSPWARRCITIRGNALAGIPWEIQQKGKPVQDSGRYGPVWLLTHVNDEQNFPDLMRSTESDLNVFGKAAWLKVRAESKIVGLLRLNGGTLEIKATSKGITEVIQKLKGKSNIYKRADVVYFHSYNPSNDFEGCSPTETARLAIESEINCNKYLAAFFENGAMPAYIVTTEQQVPEKELKRRKALWDSWFKGPDKQHKTMFADRGLKVERISFSPDELALKDVREEARKDICGAYGVPPAIAGAWEAANYAATKEQRRSLYTETVIPEGQYIEGVINAELIVEFDGAQTFHWKFADLPIMQPDKNHERRGIALLVEKGVITSEAGAAQLGYKPEEAGSGPVSQAAPIIESKTVEVISGDNGKVKPEELKVDTTGAEIDAELRKYRRKVLKRLKDGKSAAKCGFESELVPTTLMSSIEGSLEACETTEEVNAIFNNAATWGSYP